MNQPTIPKEDDEADITNLRWVEHVAISAKQSSNANMGLIDHPLTPLIVAWMEAVNKRAAYFSAYNLMAEKQARDLLNAALEELKND